MTTNKAAASPDASDDLRDEYRLDYTQSRPNRFASRMSDATLVVVLEPDVAAVFDTSESVNRLLRSVISAVPMYRTRNTTAKARPEYVTRAVRPAVDLPAEEPEWNISRK